MHKFLRGFTFFISILFLICSTPSQAGLFSQGPYEINLENADRKAAQVYLPNQYKDQENWPLVVLLHGYSASGTLQDDYFGLSYRVSHKGFILLVPEGTANAEGKQFWNATDTCCDFGHSRINDSDYLLGLIQKIQKQYHVNPQRIYLLGHSNGGFMAHRLACENSTLFAGIASLAGETFKDSSLCNPKVPVSVLQIHALDDQTIHYEGSNLGSFQYPGSVETVDRWIKLDECQETPVEEGPFNLIWSIPGKDTTFRTWSHCKNNTEVALWTIQAYKSVFHNAHIPWLSIEITNRILDFLFAHSSTSR